METDEGLNDAAPLEKVFSELAINYEAVSLRKPQSVADLGRECTVLHHAFGMDMSKRGNMFLIEDDKLVYSSAGSVVFENIVSGQKEYLIGIDEGGVGCITVHPSRKLFAVGGKGFQPKIYIYSYPELKITKVLSGGAERGYSCLNFSSEGDKLASVSTSPDFMLTVWDWEDGQMGLHSKAFGQDVYKVQFSVDDARRLTTSGVGHIRFWKMAATFTGLKLQGHIGKFGKIDLSDIEGFVELPDGKVVSGTETGSLLLWEGNFIKCRFTMVGGAPCHGGAVTYLELDRGEQCLVSASLDGFIRWWDFSAVDSAEVDSDHSMDFELLPIAEYRLGGGRGVRAMLDSGVIGGTSRFFLILDTKGRLQTITFTLSPSGHAAEDGTVQQQQQQQQRGAYSLCDTVLSLKSSAEQQVTNDEEDDEFLVDSGGESCVDRRTFDQFHAGPITGLDASPVDHLAVTCGADGTVRIIDYIARKEVACRQFSTVATCAKWLPARLESSGLLVAVGFADGVVRVLALGQNSLGKTALIRKSVFKPHNAPVADLEFNNDGTVLATAGKDGIVFFLECTSTTTGEGAAAVTVSSDNWKPLRFVTVGGPSTSGKSPVSCERLSWNSLGKTVLCSCSDSVLREVDLSSLMDPPEPGEGEAVTFEARFPIREVPVRLPVLTSSKSGSVALLTKAKTESGSDAAQSVDGGEDGTDGASGSATNPPSPTKLSAQSTAKHEELAALLPAKVSQAVYSVGRAEGGVLAACSLNQRSYLFESDPTEERPLKELLTGLYSSTGAKDYLKAPLPTALRYSWSKRFLLVGTADGSVTVRSSEYLETFARTVAHNGGVGGTAFVCNSFDDRYLVSAGRDGVLVVTRLRLELIDGLSRTTFKDLDAGVFGDDLTKPVPNNQAAPEPEYLTFVSAADEDAADSGFSKPLLADVPEQSDISGEAYSIQDNQLKLEEDAQKAAANDLKGRVLASIKVLQRDYDKVVRENESIPAAVRLSPEEMLVDGEYFAILAAEGEEMLREVHRECAYDCEKSEKLLAKVRDRLQHGLLIEEFPLTAFAGLVPGERLPVSMVKSLRAQALDPAVAEILKEVQAMVRAAELRDAQNRTNETAQRKALEAVDEMKTRLTTKEEATEVATAPADGSSGGKGAAVVEGANGEILNASSAAARRIKRKERKEALANHLKQKPAENEDDVRDLDAIRLAERTVGDFKLKCADDYEVPEEQRINAHKKVRQMAMLEESMLTMRLQFNQRFLALRSLKRQIIFAVRRDNERIREIDAQLKQSHLSEALWEPRFDPAEYPDDADEVTPTELKQYEEVRAKLSWEQAPPPAQSVTTGTKTVITKNAQTGAYEAKVVRREYTQETRLQDFLTDESTVHVTPAREDPPRYYEVGDLVLKAYAPDPASEEAKALRQLESRVPVLMAVRNAMRQRLQTSEPSPVQQLFNEDLRRRLNFEREMIVKKMHENVAAFREAVDDLRLDRHAITADLKLAELKLLTLFQEYKLLQTFESRDSTLQQKQLKCKAEETEIATLGSENRARLEGKTEEIQHWNDKLQQISAEFRAMLPESHPYAETLTKIFRKRVKRSKGGGDGEDGDDEDFEEEEEEQDDDDDDDDGEEVEDICPPGCDQPLFERILDLREKKLDTEEISAEIQRGIEDLRKTIDRLRQREKQIVKDAQQTELEVRQFQLQKQAALNQINVVVPLRTSQLYMFEASGVLTGPTDKGSQHADAEDTQLEANIELLRDADKRMLVSSVDLQSHVIFTKQNLVRLQERISELHAEIDEAKDSLRHLHRERGVLIKERERRQAETEAWSAKCLDLQMLKFGREVDLDELEARADHCKGDRDEGALRDDEETYRVKAAALTKESASLQERLTEVTLRNTQLLNEVAELTEAQLSISRELNAPGQVVSATSKLDSFKEAEETRRIVAYVQFQAKELEALRTELTMLKRKEAPPLMSQTVHSLPVPSPPFNPHQQQPHQSSGVSSAGSHQRQPGDLVLPPIPQHKR